jgi:hypothetical protein
LPTRRALGGGVSGGVSPVPYHPPAVPPGHPRPRPPRHCHHRQPDHRGADRVVCDRPDPAGRAAHPDTPGALPARPLPRRAQSAAAHLAAVHPQPAGPAGRLGRPLGRARLLVPGRRGGREGLRQAAALGRMDLLVRQEAQGLRHARRGGAVVQRRWRLQDPGGVPAVAAQAVLRARRLPDQAAAGRADAYRAGRRPAALPVSGHGQPLHPRRGRCRRWSCFTRAAPGWMSPRTRWWPACAPPDGGGGRAQEVPGPRQSAGLSRW